MARVKKQKLSLEELLEQALVKEEEQPYQVPSNWVWTRIGEITEVIGGGTPSSSVKEYYEDGDIPWISPADLSGYTEIYISKGRRNITELGLQKSSAKLMPKDTVLLSSRAPIGYVAIAENELCTNQGFKSFLPSKAFSSKYLYFYLKSIKHILESYASGTTFLELSGSKAALVEIPLPPLVEQQRIIERIESLFEKLDKAKELAQNALDSFENRKAAILHKAFTGELTAKWREENGVSLDSWEEKSIGEVFDVFSGKGFKEKEYSTTGVKLLRITNVSYNNLEWKDTKYLPCEYAEKEKKLLLNKGDIVMALNRPITNNKLKVCAIDTDDSYILYQRVGCLRTKIKDINYKFALYFLQSDNFRKQVEMNLQGSDQPYINIPPLKQLTIPFCSIKEQEQVVFILDNIIDQEQQAQELCDVIEKIDLMKKAILARAFRGELGTNNPEEESAIELLKEVLKEKL